MGWAKSAISMKISGLFYAALFSPLCYQKFRADHRAVEVRARPTKEEGSAHVYALLESKSYLA